MPFLDRRDAGRRLVERLRPFRGADTVVLGLPCGGIPVAFEVATALRAPMDVAVVRKMKVPNRPRLVVGAASEAGIRVLDAELLARANLAPPELARLERDTRETVLRDVARFRGARARLPLGGRTVVLVDDGVATAATARAACLLARSLGAARVIFAVPVGPCHPIRDLSRYADNVVCLETPALFHTVAHWYSTFEPVEVAEVNRLLDLAAEQLRDQPTPPLWVS